MATSGSRPAQVKLALITSLRQIPWLFPSSSHAFVWDSTMCADTTRVAALRESMSRAFRAPLVPAQQQQARRASCVLSLGAERALAGAQILAEFAADSKLVFHCGLTPRRLPELVENNPAIAIEALLKLMERACSACETSLC